MPSKAPVVPMEIERWTRKMNPVNSIQPKNNWQGEIFVLGLES